MDPVLTATLRGIARALHYGVLGDIATRHERCDSWGCNAVLPMWDMERVTRSGSIGSWHVCPDCHKADRERHAPGTDPETHNDRGPLYRA